MSVVLVEDDFIQEMDEKVWTGVLFCFNYLKNTQSEIPVHDPLSTVRYTFP